MLEEILSYQLGKKFFYCILHEVYMFNGVGENFQWLCEQKGCKLGHWTVSSTQHS